MPPDDDNVGGGQGGAAGNAGGNGGNAIVDRLKSLELGGLSSFDPKGDPTMLCACWKRWKRAFNLYVKSRGVSDEGQKVALMLHTGDMALHEVYYSLVEEDADLSLAESINPFTATSRDRATMLNSHRECHERGEAQLQESERISPKFQLEPEI